MLTEFLTRLAIALPLVCAAAALSLWAIKKGWIQLPSMALRTARPGPEALVEVLALKPLSQTARVAVIRFDGRTHLVGIGPQGIGLLATAGEARSALPQAAFDSPEKP